MARRAKGEGTIYYSAARKRWILQLAPETPGGTRPQRSFKTQRAALDAKAALEAERKAGADLTAKQPTVGEFLIIWLTEIIIPMSKASTADSYGYVIRKYITPHLGTVRLDDLTPAMVQRWVNTLTKQLGPATVRSAYRRLRTALSVAVDWHYLTSNPAERARLPKLPPSVARRYTLEETRKLLRSVEGWRLEALVWALVVLGLRRGEALGLAWRDLDWKAGTIKITQQVQLINGKTVISDTPKTETSRRTLPLPPGLLARLRDAWDERQEERKLRGADWHEHGLIFPSEVGTPLITQNLHGVMKRAMARAGVPIRRIHDLRHTCASLLAEQGEQESLRGQLLGHKPVTMTDFYTHASMDAIRAAVTRLERSLEGEAEDGRMAGT